MALILKKLFSGYSWLFNEIRDPRSDGYYFMSSPFVPLVMMCSYLYLVYNIGPKFMKHRPPYNLEKVMQLFNFVQVLVNSYLVYHGVKELFYLNWDCALIDYSNEPHPLFVLKLAYVYFLTKIADLLDTIFFILRKRERQVTFLHVYHHFGMIFIGWVGVKFLAGGHSLFMGIFNSFVHAVMYFYYLLTSLKPEYKKNIWWKKHITQLQLIQFMTFLIIYGRLLFKNDCAYPKIASYFFVPQNFFMLILFGDFYYKTYVKPKKAKSLNNIKKDN